MARPQAIHRYIIGIGSNLGNKEGNINQAFEFLNTPPLNLTRKSRLYAYEAWGYQSDNSFINACAEITTALEPDMLLPLLKTFETGMGRVQRLPGQDYADRPMDLDIIFWNDDAVYTTPVLMIPHPMMHQRLFVLEPLAEICPGMVHPLLRQPVSRLLQDLNHGV